VAKAALIEYALAIPPLVLLFDFNPQSLSRTRSVTIKNGSTAATRGGYDFALPTETPRAALGVSVQPETFSIEILVDATDRMNSGDPLVPLVGIEPELDTLRSMVEPKSQGPGGFQMLSSLGLGGDRAFQRNETASVLLFLWGTHLLPVFLTSVQVNEKAHLPSLVPYRANVTLAFQVIEGGNPFYKVEKVRQVVSSAINTGRTIGAIVGGLF
jgi:Contractile injection system tube protein